MGEYVTPGKTNNICNRVCCDAKFKMGTKKKVKIREQIPSWVRRFPTLPRQNQLVKLKLKDKFDLEGICDDWYRDGATFVSDTRKGVTKILFEVLAWEYK